MGQLLNPLPDYLAAARLLVYKKRGFLSSILWAMPVISKTKMDQLHSMAVDKYGRLYVNLETVSKWSVNKIAVAFMHEINHLIRWHFDRCRQYEGYTVNGIPMINLIQDLEINDGLAKEAVESFNIKFDEGWLLPSQFNLPDDLLAEEYGEMLLKNNKAQYSKDGSGNSCSGKGHKGNATGKKGGGSKQSGGQGEGEGESDGSGVGEGNCGSCTGGGQRPWEDPPPPGEADGKEDSTYGLSKDELSIIKRQIAEAIRQANNDKSRGNVPSNWLRWAETVLEPPRIPWTKETAAIIRNARAKIAGVVDYSMKKRSTRSSPEIILPGLVKPVVDIVSVIDTSGSMSDTNLSTCLREYEGVLRAVGAQNSRVLAYDASAGPVQKVWKASQVQLVGGGGTDMSEAIIHASKLKPRPDIIIVFTDGYTPWPENPVPGIKKVIAVIVEESNASNPPSWIKSIRTN